MIPCLLDANVFITAYREHYRFSVCPGFWDWLVQAHTAGQVFSIDKVQDEITGFADPLARWVARLPASFFLQTDASLAPALARLAAWTQGQGYRPEAITTFFNSADYYLVAHAMTTGWRVVTHERPGQVSRRRIKIPDACAAMGVASLGPFQMLEEFGAKFSL